MKRRTRFSRMAGKVTAVVLSLAMAVPAVPAAARSAEAAETKLYYGDVDGSGAPSADDSLAILKHVVKLQEITDPTALILADANKDGKVDASDSLKILKVVVKLEEAEEYVAEEPSQEPTPTPESHDYPPIPTPERPEVTWSPSDAVPGEPITIRNQNGAYYDETNDIYTLYDSDHNQTRGMFANNPFAGHSELAEDPEELIAASTAEPGKDLVWDLPGAAYKAESENFPSGADLRVTEFYAPELDTVNTKDTQVPQRRARDYVDIDGNPLYTKGVTYTVPQYTKGATISFWAKSTDEDGNDTSPVLLFTDASSFVLAARLNGSTHFKTTEDENYLRLDRTGVKKYNEWAYYTVTIANDWMQVYVNGEEQLYNMNEDTIKRKTISHFNDGFVTRYNPIGEATLEDVANDWRGYLLDSGAFYWNGDQEKWLGHDNYSVFGNGRFRGINQGGSRIMDMITSGSTRLYIGGYPTDIGNAEGMNYRVSNGTQISGLTYYLDELTPAQIKANYEAAKATQPAADAPVPESTYEPSASEGPEESEAPLPEGEGYPVKLTTDEDLMLLNEFGTFTQDADTGVITFNERQNTGSNAKPAYWGAIFNNPLAGNTSDKVVSSVDDAIKNYCEEQGIEEFPTGSKKAGDSDENFEIKGATDTSLQSWRNNYYDFYLGDVTSMAQLPKPANYNDPNPETDLEKTPYERTKWTTGASYSFWFKPTEDMTLDEPILSMYKYNSYLFYMDAKGTVLFSSLLGTTSDGSVRDWDQKHPPFSENAKPYNSFIALGDSDNKDAAGNEIVHKGQWNYYTVTFANDMITVYINGKELIYDKLNLNRGDIKNFNAGYLTRYNTIGLAIAENDPVHQYLTKSGFIQTQFHETFDTYEYGFDSEGNGRRDRGDNVSIRANSTYERYLNPNGTIHYYDTRDDKKILDFLTESDGTNYLVLGGVNYASLLDNSPWVLNTFSSTKFSVEHKLPAGVQAADLKFYEGELTPAEVQENYQKACESMPQ